VCGSRPFLFSHVTLIPVIVSPFFDILIPVFGIRRLEKRRAMKMLRARWMKAGAVSALIFGMATAASAAPATVDARDLVLRLQRLERDMRDVQAETFRQSGGKPPAAAAAAPAPAAEPAPQAAPMPAPVMPDLDPLIRRLTDLEDSIGRLTGQMEELGHQVQQVSEKTDRLQKQLDFQATQAMHADAGANGAVVPAPDMPATLPAEPGKAVASLTPEASLRGAPPTNLGQIPANTPLPTPSVVRPADPKQEFDSAMNLLARAQYDQASQAFRKFADDHPDEDKASDALYWTGDIAYSAKKDYPEAARDFAELLKKYPKAQHAPEGMLKLGLALFELGQMKEGCAALAALPAKYPDATAAVATRAKSERTTNKCK
jgi:tol-pal system protein YbgF